MVTRSLKSQLTKVDVVRLTIDDGRQRLKKTDLVFRIPAYDPTLIVDYRRAQIN